jgi:hypothetical protein
MDNNQTNSAYGNEQPGRRPLIVEITTRDSRDAANSQDRRPSSLRRT